MAKPSMLSVALVFLFMTSYFSAPVNSLCECGYTTSLNIDGQATKLTFTDLLETDFIRGVGNVALDTDWRVQAYNVSGAENRGQYGYVFFSYALNLVAL